MAKPNPTTIKINKPMPAFAELSKPDWRSGDNDSGEGPEPVGQENHRFHRRNHSENQTSGRERPESEFGPLAACRQPGKTSGTSALTRLV